ncbi:hypothetical protein M0G74_16790 [Microbulbifer sp. CAU 1566]|uniref:hypothetical protein n=1 Tax=Microbulbifer sp. CAU 1566 TaxID=2933269 RepID=UPI002005D486|nr:hypothetical protein [Microbulbifer sp. CAU 1566]MCK7598933.1 hypothetical protein [Microbulbifer sp. CAU 1566]
MDKPTFLNEVERRFTQLFKASKGGYAIPPAERHRLQGFMQAGVFMNLCNRSELNAIMEKTHLAIFRKTIEERKLDTPVSWIYEETDYSLYETPAYERRY